MKKLYGTCERCGEVRMPVFFTEEERKVTNGIMVLTGRKRQACSHLECPNCGKKECVDDTFDGPWR
jgi:uncharacterized ferredoxin-like protein